jgi:hypothetical protein
MAGAEMALMRIAMKRFHRVTNPRVINGKVQRKNRTALSPNCFRTHPSIPILERHKPGFGYRHILKLNEVAEFIRLLPDWSELSQGLNGVVLARGRRRCDGWHVPGVVAVCAWERGLWREVRGGYYAQHQDLFSRLEVPCQQTEDGFFLCRFTESSIRAYQLLHVLLHELGHHHDRMTTGAKKDSCRGEDFAETYALDYEQVIWDRYLQVFGLY